MNSMDLQSEIDDTNPVAEKIEYEAIKDDLKWLGFDLRRSTISCIRLF